MLDTSARLLRILSLLQSRPRWSGPELAERLAVTPRTIRRDVDRLRRLGYPVDAGPGAEGGYRLGVGGSLPPLLLDDDEAVAVVLALGVTAGEAVRGIEEPALAALAKLDRLLPPALRARVAALRSATLRLGLGGAEVDPGALTLLAQAAAGQERVALRYRDREGRVTERRVEPFRLVSTGRRWYLVAHDVDRLAWRTFRVDRILGAEPTGHRFQLVDPPDPAALVSAAVAVSPYRWQAKVVVHAPVADVTRRVPPSVAVTTGGPGATSVLVTGADDLGVLLGHLVSLGHRFEVLEPPELRALAAEVGARVAADHAEVGDGT